PYVLMLDYIQSIKDQGEKEADAVATTADLLMRGVVAWDPDEMAKFSGVDLRSYAGMAWPDGMEHHRVAVIVYAQLNKQYGSTQFYKKGARGVSLTDFTLEFEGSGEPGWVDAEGNAWCWEVRE